jgi:hypothetical protein
MRWLIVFNLIAWIANFAGMTFAFMVLHIEIDRNSQGEYIDEFGMFDLSHALQTFAIFYLTSAIITGLFLSLAIVLVNSLFLLARWILRRSA